MNPVLEQCIQLRDQIIQLLPRILESYTDCRLQGSLREMADKMCIAVYQMLIFTVVFDQFRIKNVVHVLRPGGFRRNIGRLE